MSETKPPRLPACARGTDHRIDCGDHYWVRLVTRNAMQAEGECLQNCLRHGHRQDYAGPDDLKDAALWSLRRAEDAVSIALAQVDEDGCLDEFKGPYNNQVSGTGYRQLQALRDYLVMYGASLTFDEDDVLVGEDGATYRPDKAPKEVRDAAEAKQRAECEERMRRYEEMRAAARRAQDSQRVITWEMPAQVGRTQTFFENPIGLDVITGAFRSLAQPDMRAPVEVTRQDIGNGTWNVMIHDRAEFYYRVIMGCHFQELEGARAADLARGTDATCVRKRRNGDGTWELIIVPPRAGNEVLSRCIFPEEGETAPTTAPIEQVPAPQAQITIEDVAIARRYQSAFHDFSRLTERAWASSFVMDSGAAARLRSAWNRFRADPTPAPRPAPDLTTRRGRTEAAMQRRQAQLADRRWVQENLREQRRARR